MAMKRMGFAAALAFVCLMTVIPARAAEQEVRGFVVAPHPGRVAGIVVESCPGVVDGTLWWAIGSQTNHYFTVNASTWGLPFSLKPNHPAANLDIAFWAGGAGWIRYGSKAFGGEYGVVPSGASGAVVCLAVGAPTRFTYRAG
jgi:hypothetical protein